MNPGLEQLQAYPFERLKKLLADIDGPAADPIIDLSIGEPAHATPKFIHEALIDNLPATSRYPATRGLPELRGCIADWLAWRYDLAATAVTPEQHVLSLNGTREGLFAIAQLCIDRRRPDPLVLMPNPGYQVYEGAALLAGATPYYLDLVAKNGYQPDYDRVPAEVWERCQLLYLCSPGNPCGTTTALDALVKLILLARRHDFIVVADECYSELYYDETAPPVGILQAAASLNSADFSHCLAVHSLSKRSNAPGLRSGFIAGDPDIIEKFYHYRTYHGSAMPIYVQRASIAAWSDEDHVRRNRRMYRAKYAAVASILAQKLSVEIPPGGFYLWLHLPVDDQHFARLLYGAAKVKILPGSFLARSGEHGNPGERYIRLALVPDIQHCKRAAVTIAALLDGK